MKNLFLLILLFICGQNLQGQFDAEYVFQSDKNLSVFEMTSYDDELIISGHYYEETASRDLFFIKTNFQGELLQSVSIGTDSREGFVKGGLFLDSDENIICFGNTTYLNNGPVLDDPFFISLNQQFNISDKKSWGAPDVDDQFGHVIPTSDGGVIAVGLFGWDPKGGIIVKMDSGYNIEWANQYLTNDVYINFGSAIENEDGNFICTATHQLDANTSNLVLITLDQNGTLISQFEYEFENYFLRGGSEIINRTADGIQCLISINNIFGEQDILHLVLNENGTVNNAQSISAAFDFSIYKFIESDFNSLILAGSYKDTDFHNGLIIELDGVNILSAFSSSSESLDTRVPALIENCAGESCEYFIGVNRSDENKDGNFSIVRSKLNCPNLDSDLFTVESVSFSQSEFSGMSPYNMNQIDNASVNSDFMLDIDQISRSVEIELGNDTIICAETEIELDATNPFAATYEWSTGEFSPRISIDAPGTYSVTISDGCDDFIDEILVQAYEEPKFELYAANVFSPNGDGINDCFEIAASKEIMEIDFSIFDRWGNQVFQSDDTSLCWDGIYKGKLVASDVYVYSYTLTHLNCAGVPTLSSGGGDILVL